jgi:hypothetical protein
MDGEAAPPPPLRLVRNMFTQNMVNLQLYGRVKLAALRLSGQMRC